MTRHIIPEGWRLLSNGEAVTEGDRIKFVGDTVWANYPDTEDWEEVVWTVGKTVGVGDWSCICIRKEKEQKQVSEREWVNPWD